MTPFSRWSTNHNVQQYQAYISSKRFSVISLLIVIREQHDRRCSTTTSQRIPPLNNTTIRCLSSRVQTIQPRSNISITLIFHCAHHLNLDRYNITLLSSWQSFFCIVGREFLGWLFAWFIHSIKSLWHNTALVNNLANVKVGLVAAGKQASKCSK